MCISNNGVFIILFLINCIGIIHSKIHCGDEMDNEACYVRSHINKERVIFVRACPSGYFCPSTYNYPKCAQKTLQANEGEECLVHTDCQIGKCFNKKCEVLPDGEPCDYDEHCKETSICSLDGICSPMKELHEECNYSTDCKIGLECIDSTCQKIGYGALGSIVDTEKGCQTGYARTDDDGKLVCVELINEEECKEENGSYFCQGDLYDGKTEPKTAKLECTKNWDDNYICPTNKTETFLKYIDAFYENLKSLKKVNDNRITHRYTLNSEQLGVFFLDYEYYFQVYGANDCIRIFYYRELQFSSFISLSITVFFYFLVL